ncbi:MAG: hypothetical protein L0220_30385 [Acidobacteria bacterium]|nr:hypothetical protein [Acidobacteriota bacterium]
MTFEELYKDLKCLTHQAVTFKRLACNSIIIYFFGEPGDDTVISVFIDPTWRYHKNGKIIVGSYDLQIEPGDYKTKEEYEERFDYLCSLTDGLNGAELINCTVEPESFDLTMEFSANQVLRSFANSAFDEKNWTYRNRPKQITAYVSSLGIRMKEAKE